MKVELAVVKKEYLQTRALEPHMILGRLRPMDERLAIAVEKQSKGRYRRMVIDDAPEEMAKPRRGRPRKVVEE